ncbi:MAG: hypothetical protein K1Y01_21275 [Vicinamibacteria bacterium]|nr:hypothetical protein [Vicinamibacteria bacterium]
MNKRAVALAADSAMSIGNGGKTYNSSNKVFALSKVRPVGIMVYSAAEFMGVPWETIVKIYRASTEGALVHKTLEGYASAFFEFLRVGRSRGLFSEEDEKAVLDRALVTAVRRIPEMAEREMGRRMEAGEDVGAVRNDLPNILAKCADDLHDQVQTFRFLPGWGDKDVDEFSKNQGARVEEIWKKHLPAHAVPPKLIPCVVRAICCEIEDGLFSGVVIAGFGDADIFPKLVSKSLRGVQNGRLWEANEDRTAVTSQNQAEIRAYAQGEMVNTFMDGIDPQQTALLDTALEKVLCEDYPNLLVSKGPPDPALRDRVKQDLTALGQQALKTLQDQMENLRSQNARKITQAVAHLEKDDLASMARALVNLTSLKRRVTLDIESVGGPIDVAVISKGDGFIWMDRKHYFEPHLNQQFFVNYRGDAHAHHEAKTPKKRR